MSTTSTSATLHPSPDLAPLDPARTLYSRAWRYWAAGVLITFAAIELPGLHTEGRHGTLTAQLRRRRAISAAAIGAFGAWAVIHVGVQGRDA